MAYLNNIPQATQQINSTQPQIQGNFGDIKTLIDVDHETFGSANEGMHKYVHLPVQTAAPILGVNNGFYNVLDSGATEINQTFSRTQRFSGVGLDVPMTASVLSVANPAAGSDGFTFLPSGIILRWLSQAVVSGLQTITLPATLGYPVFNSIFQIIITPWNPSVTTNISISLVNILSATQFRINASGVGAARILVIGY